MRRLALGIAIALLVATPLAAAPPAVPTSLPYQGLLLDGLGAPRTGSVDLTLRIFDGVVGGTLVYKQSFPAVALADGVFTLQLGPTGDGADAPANPLTTSLATALAGDAGATAPLRFLEVTVNAEGALARTQILASAYAVRASSADSATVADSATTASSATDVVNVGGVDAGFLAAVIQDYNFDGGPPNLDPREGLPDVDGDGLANFLDSDNDGDTYSDQTEVDSGTDMNLRTPRVTSVAPTSGWTVVASDVTVNGASFEPGLTVLFGDETPTPVSVTPTSFQVTVGPKPPSTVSVTVTLPNGQTRTLPNAFTFSDTIAHALAPPGPGNIPLVARPGTFEVAMAGDDQYGVGFGAGQVFPLDSRGTNGRLAVAFGADGDVAALRGRDTGSGCAVEVLVDADGDDELGDETGRVIETVGGAAATLLGASLVQDSAGGWVAGYARMFGFPQAILAHDRNADGDFADAGERLSVEGTIASFATPITLDVALTTTDQVAFAYARTASNELRVAWDRNGDGDFADTIGGNPELATLDTNAASTACLGIAFDANDHLAIVYTAGGTKLARDANGDGDFADAGEIEVLSPTSANACDVVHRAGDALAVTYALNGSTQLVTLIDGNEDGDFADAGESNTFSSAASRLGIALNGTHAIVANETALRVVPSN